MINFLSGLFSKATYEHKYTGICGWCEIGGCYDCLGWYPHLFGPRMPGYCQCVCNRKVK